MAQSVFWAGWRLSTNFQGWTGPLSRVWPRTNCRYLANSSELTSFLSVWLSVISCAAVWHYNNKGFSPHQCKGLSRCIYLLILFLSPFLCLLKRQNTFSQACRMAYAALSHLTVKWSRKPQSVPFHRGASSWISTWGSTGCSLLFPLKGDRNVSWFCVIENGSISSCWVLLV